MGVPLLTSPITTSQQTSAGVNKKKKREVKYKIGILQLVI